MVLINFAAYWHCDENNRLCRGALVHSAEKCATRYDIYIPHNLHDCPHVLVLSINPHNHPPPLPIKTPPQIADCLKALLLYLEWKLADATPRRLALDSGFICDLRHALGSAHCERDPSPHDLHPSLENLDHLRHMITGLQSSKFPHGTGFFGTLYILSVPQNVIHFLFTGAKSLVSEHEQLPLDHRYLHCVEQYDLPSGDEFCLVICMTAQISSLLVEAKRISIDTSFKHVHGWQEFEIEGWDNHHQ